MQITTSAARLAAWLAFCVFATTACVYHMPIQQGNYPDAAALTQVRSGMTRAQVRYLLGTPIVPGAFDNDRWDYDYYLKAGNGVAPRRARARRCTSTTTSSTASTATSNRRLPDR